MERILNLLGLEKTARHEELPCLVRFTEGDSQVSVLEVPLPCGHFGYVVDLEYRLNDSDIWVPVGSLRDFNLEESIKLLQQAKVCIDNFQTE